MVMLTPQNQLLSIDAEELPNADPAEHQFGALTPILAAMLPESAERRARMKKLLRNAGEYGAFAYQNFAAVRYLGLVLPIVIFGTLFVFVPPELESLMLVCLVVFAATGWAVPGVMMRSKAAERLGEIERGLPDMLDILNMCVSQGMTVPAGLRRVGDELGPVYPALSKELQILSDQSRVGSLEQALMNFSERVDLPEVHSLTSLLIQTERMGTSISDALAQYSDGMRETLRQRSDAKANAATFKLLFPTVFCLMPAVFLFLLGPAIIQLSDFFTQDGGTILDRNSAQMMQISQEQ